MLDGDGVAVLDALPGVDGAEAALAQLGPHAVRALWRRCISRGKFSLIVYATYVIYTMTFLICHLEDLSAARPVGRQDGLQVGAGVGGHATHRGQHLKEERVTNQHWTDRVR